VNEFQRRPQLYRAVPPAEERSFVTCEYYRSSAQKDGSHQVGDAVSHDALQHILKVEFGNDDNSHSVVQ
jgi:hypothetical protein